MPSQFSSRIHTGPAIFSPSNRRLLGQLLAVTGLLLVSRAGQHIPLPGVDERLFAQFLGGHSGLHQSGAMARLSLFALGLWPYITVSLVAQLAIWAFPGVAALTGTAQGRRRLNQYIRLFTVLMAAAQASGVAGALENIQAGRLPGEEALDWTFHLSTAVNLTAGVMLLVWLSDEISRRGLGDGVLLILFVEFVGRAPLAVDGGLQTYRTGLISDQMLAGAIAVMAAAFAAVVAVESARRHIRVEPAGRITALTLRLDPAGVAAPLVGAVLFSLALVPLVAFEALQGDETLRQAVAMLGPGQPLHMLLYGLAVAGAAYAMSASGASARLAAARLEAEGASLPEAGPDESPEEHIACAQRRLAAFNALYLAVLCLLPEAFIMYFGLPFSYGGAPLLIAILTCLNIITSFGQETSSASVEKYGATMAGAAASRPE